MIAIIYWSVWEFLFVAVALPLFYATGFYARDTVSAAHEWAIRRLFKKPPKPHEIRDTWITEFPPDEGSRWDELEVTQVSGNTAMETVKYIRDRWDKKEFMHDPVAWKTPTQPYRPKE